MTNLAPLSFVLIIGSIGAAIIGSPVAWVGLAALAFANEMFLLFSD